MAKRREQLLPFKIETLYAFIAQDGTGHEGLPAMHVGDAWMPLIAADEKRLDQLREIAQVLADGAQDKIVLCKFERRVELEVISPQHERN